MVLKNGSGKIYVIYSITKRKLMEDYIAFGIGIILAMFCIVILEKIEAERENNEKEKFIKYNN